MKQQRQILQNLLGHSKGFPSPLRKWEPREGSERWQQRKLLSANWIPLAVHVQNRMWGTRVRVEETRLQQSSTLPCRVSLGKSFDLSVPWFSSPVKWV